MLIQLYIQQVGGSWQVRDSVNGMLGKGLDFADAEKLFNGACVEYEDDGHDVQPWQLQSVASPSNPAQTS